MGLFDAFKKKSAVALPKDCQFAVEPGKVYQPIEGEVIPLKDINDGVFSDAVLGNGCGLRPSGEVVYAPFNGTITNVTESLHAIGITSDDNIELLIHVGMDTVSMNGKGFRVLVENGQRVSAGQVLMTFSKADIAAAGFPDTVAIVVTNTDDHNAIHTLYTGKGEVGQEMLQIS